MPLSRLPNYLKSHRKRLELSQEEVAFLLGPGGPAKVCREERFTREASLRSALAYQVIYQKPISDLFAGLFDQVTREVQMRAQTLKRKQHLQAPSAKIARKRIAIARISSGSSDANNDEI